jgi:hypothetical protein
MSVKKTIGNGKAGPGRPKGKPNKLTAALKDMILTAMDEAHPEGSVAYLRQQAQDNPVAFMGLVGKVLPLQVAGAGEQGQHLHEIAWRVVADD